MNLFRNKASGKEMEVLPLRQSEEETMDMPHSFKTQSITNFELGIKQAARKWKYSHLGRVRRKPWTCRLA